MQKTFVSIILMAFLAQNFSQAFYYIDYLVKKKEYMSRCVNKARPMLHCDGKCQLMKKIKAQEERDQAQAPELKLAAKSEVFSSRSFFASLPVPPASRNNLNNSHTNSGSPIDQPSSVFHPPQLSLS